MSAAVTRPQDDLFRHVNGTWLDESEIPADQASYGAMNELRDDSEADCRVLVEEAAATVGSPAGSAAQLIGDLFASFMDVERVEALGTAPLARDLHDVANLTDIAELPELLGRLHRGGVGGVVSVYIDNDPGQPDRYVAHLYQGGLGLPDESYYRDDRYADLRQSYLGHIGRMLDLAGLDDSRARAESVLGLETALAAGHWDRVRTRDVSQTFNPMDRAALDAMLPGWFAGWLTGVKAPAGLLDEVIVMTPSFLTALEKLLTAEQLPAWRNWLALRVVRAAAPYGPAALVAENFDFYGHTLSGTPELRERWKRGVAVVEGGVGEALGALYVERHFPPAAKDRMDQLVGNLIDAYRHSISSLEWMTDETKSRAQEKLASFTPKIGYPAAFRDYAGLTIDRDDLLGNVHRASAMELDRDFAKVGKPVDRDEWFMTPQTVNAYYNPGMNEIVFPAAILRPPFFDPAVDDATNFGGIGAVIGHEIGHGFDDQGSKYDGTGALSDWWTETDRKSFDALTANLIDQYSALVPVGAGGQHVNGALTIGENIGDLGGLGIAIAAWRLSLGGDEIDVLDGLQRLFCNWAAVWRAKSRDPETLRRLTIDPHSPPEFRCNQVVRNLDEFHTAFTVVPGDRLWLDPAERVRIW